MAVAMSTFGSTLSDLQRLTNEDRALDYQRANAQDAVNAQRLSEFLRARSEDNRTKAMRDAEMARIVEASQSRSMQDRQFDVQQRNLMDLGRLDNQTRKDVAEITARSRGFDPRALQTIADIDALNAEGKRKFDFSRSLSDARKRIVTEMKGMSSAQPWHDAGAPNRGFFDRRVSPRWTELDQQLKRLDKEALPLGLTVDPATGGYLFEPFTPIPVPAMLNQNPPAPSPSSVPPPSAASPTPDATKMLTPEEAAQLPDGTVYRGLDGRLRRRTAVVPSPPAAPPEATPLPPVSPWDLRSQLQRTTPTTAPETPANADGEWVLEGGRYVFKKRDRLPNINWESIFRQLQQPARPTF